MVVAIGIWSVILAPGQPHSVVPQADIRITNVALGEDASGRTTVKFTYNTPIQVDSDDEEDAQEPLSTTVLCSLTAGKFEQSMTDIILEQNEEYVFEVVGQNTVYLTGNYIDQTPEGMPYHGDSDSDLDSEGAYDLREVSSDVEIDPEELESDASRFEEVDKEEEPKSLKRPRDSDAMDTETPKLSKHEKKLNKKLKAEDGKAVAAGNPTNAERKKEKKEKKTKEAADDTTKEEKKEKPSTAEAKEITGGIKVKDMKVGTGPMAKKGNTVGMRYIGKFVDGKVFDKNVKGKPFTFRLGKAEVIKGWDEGIVGMQVGGERLLTVPASMGYGKKGTDGIPGNSTLIFECKLVEIR